MKKDNNIDDLGSQSEIKWRIEEWFPELDPEIVSKLKDYHTELLRFNAKLNLISSSTIHEADEKHIADSILGGRVILKNTDEGEIFDIGSGNGCPGLVMAILAPDREFVLVDRDMRKIEFLKTVISRLDLPNVKTLCISVEDLPENTVKCAVSRAFASLAGSLLAMRSQFTDGGHYYHFKSVNWYREVADIPVQLCTHWKPSEVSSYRLPVSDTESAIVVLDKVK